MKLRTHKTTSKRIRITGGGKIMQPTSSSQHLRHNKSKRILANSKRLASVNSTNLNKISKLLPYLGK